MPDIPDRSKREETIETLLRRALGRTRTRIIEALGDPPSLSNVPDYLWQQMQADVEEDTRRAIAIVFLLAMRRMNDASFTAAAALAGKRAATYAEAQASRLARGMVDTFQDRLRPHVQEAKRRLAGGESQAQVEADLKRTAREIAEEQASRGGVTETTAANSAGEMAWKEIYEGETGVQLIAFWRTERDSLVCPICRQLDRLAEDAWSDEFPDGPPAHVNCRCYLEFEPAEVEV